MIKIDMSAERVRRIEKIYDEMETAYAEIAGSLDFSCVGCPDNCCDSHFLHHTYVEWAYLCQGFQLLDHEKQTEILSRCQDYVAACARAEEAGERPRIMCPLNENGLCILYQHRLLVCRTHGVPAIMRFPNGQARRFPGCFRCQEIVESRFAKADHAPHVERTPMLTQLLALENELCEQQRASLPKVAMTIAEMLLKGYPQP